MVPTTTILLLVSTLLPQAFAALFITSPVGSTTGHGGQNLTVQWNDDNTQPDLRTIGPCSVGIFAGNPQQQTQLQAISASVDVSKLTSLSFKVDPTIGPSSSEYFVRFTSLGLKDTKNPQFNYQSFSAKFQLDAMTGQFPPDVAAQIKGLTTAAGGATTTPSKPTAATNSSPSTPSGLSTVTTPKPTSTSTSKPSSAALPMYGSHASGLVGLVAMLFGILV